MKVVVKFALDIEELLSGSFRLNLAVLSADRLDSSFALPADHVRYGIK